MIRPAATGLATAFYRLYLRDSLASAPARPATLLATIASERLPLANGAFGRALQSLLEGGYLVPAPEAAVALTPLGAAERVAERERWRAVIPTILRLVNEPGPEPRPAPAVAEIPAVEYRSAAVAESYLDRVLVAALRERVADARDGGRSFTLVLGVADIDTSSEATRRAIVHRCVRASLGGASTLFGGDVSAFRYGESGIALVAPIVGDEHRGGRIATLLRARIDELLRTMTMSVRAFAGARWQVRVGEATWSSSLVTSGAMLRIAQDALARDDMSRRPAA